MANPSTFLLLTLYKIQAFKMLLLKKHLWSIRGFFSLLGIGAGVSWAFFHLEIEIFFVVV